MSWLSSLFSRSPEKQIERLRKKAREPHGEAANRINAVQRLLEMGTPDSCLGALDRFKVNISPTTQDEQEKQQLVGWIEQMGREMVDPLMRFLRSERQVYWPLEGLRRILPAEEYRDKLVEWLHYQWENPPSSSDPIAQVLRAVNDVERSPELDEAVALYLEDDDDDVLLAAMDYFFSGDDQSRREKILEAYLECEDRPRVRAWVLERLAETGWTVKGYRPAVEETLPGEYTLTREGVLKKLLMKG
ncbi:MAG TPA: hypothetical protein VLU25_11675 [Acidobacteriota bacterium]|nr:hypothetical protein [Acidobacteriota bacterium]